MDPKELSDAYTRQLREWVERSEHTQKQLVALSAGVPLDDVLDETKLSRLIQEPPANVRRRRPLLKLLAVLYSLGIISCEEAGAFWHAYSIGPLPDGLTWEAVCELFEQAQPASRAGAEREAEPIAPAPEPSRRRFPAGALVSLVTAAGVIAAILFGRALILRDRAGGATASDPSGACIGPVPRVEPEFLYDQGVSLYGPGTDAPHAGALSGQVRTLAIDQTGVWLGYAPGADGLDGVSHYIRGQKGWMHCLGLALSEGQVVNDFAFGPDDTVYVATDGAGIARLRDGEWMVYTTDHGLPSNVVYDLAWDDSGVLWAGTLEGVAELIGEHWEVVYRAAVGKLAGNQVHSLLLDDSHGARWFGLAFGGLSRLTSDGQWSTYLDDDGGLGNIRALVEDEAGGVWVATDGGGVAYFHDDTWEVFTAANSDLPSDRVQDVALDHFGRIWAATDQGVALTADRGASWQLHSRLDVLDIAFGCPGCDYDEDDVWLAVRGRGVAHSGLPPAAPLVRVEAPLPQQLKPGEKYVFEVTVEVLSDRLDEGDGLFSTTPEAATTYGAWPRIPVVGHVARGQSYTFSNIANPIVAPEEPGTYQIAWRLWQSNRYASEPIVIEFEVVDA